MTKLIKHLRPFSLWIILIFAILFGQAMADLSLPGYMADIVNVGIQQNGISDAVPEVVRQEEFDKLNLFMDQNDQQTVNSTYLLLDREQLSPDQYNRYQKKYPLLSTANLYVLNTDDRSELERLNTIFSRTMPIVAAIEQNALASIPGFQEQIPSGVDPFAFIRSLPPEQLQAFRQYLSESINSLPETMLRSYSAVYIKNEYQAIGVDLGSIQNRYMLRIGILMFLLTLGSVAASVCVGYISAGISAALGRNLRKGLFERVESFSNAEFDKFSTASLITRTTNDITQIQMLMVMLFRFVFYAPIMGIGGVLRVINADTSMLWIIAAAVATMLMLMGTMFMVALPKFRKIQTLVDKVNLAVREMLNGLMVIRAFNTQQHEENKFDKANVDLTRVNLFVNRVMILMMPLMMLIMNGVMLLIIWVGAHQIDLGNMQVGDMMAFMQYAMFIIMSFLMISMVFIMIPRASISAERVSEVIETTPVIVDPVKPLSFNGARKGLVEFRNVSFRYPGYEEDVLKHITFTAEPGETTAFIGSTGSGKSTLVNLIVRFYDSTEGQVLVDGLNVREVTQHDLREKIGYVSQKPVIFSGTIESNIKYGNESVTAEEMEHFTSVAQAADFINSSENGFNMAVSQGGTNLSGGQKQRLSIARALARKPEIFILDDSFSALDFKTDAALRRALKQETDKATVLIVTQRVGTVMDAEKIVVLDEGIVAGTGNHRELMETCEVYREIATSQLTREELAQ